MIIDNTIGNVNFILKLMSLQNQEITQAGFTPVILQVHIRHQTHQNALFVSNSI